MAEKEPFKKRDLWDKADVAGKWLIPTVVLFATLWFNSALKEREANQKTFEVAIGVLRAPGSDETKVLRQWALAEFQKVAGTAGATLPTEAIEEIKKGAQLPGTSQLQLPTAGELRVSIIRLEGSSAEQSERVRSALITAGYTNVSATERPLNSFPDRAEVRFYYPADSQNAKSLSDYINSAFGIAIQPNDRSQDRDASRHRAGDLHIYLR
jgi:hypothetical protein